MADHPEEPSAPEDPELRQDDLVEKLLPDPSQHQALTVISGLLGRSLQAGYWRLYLAPSLQEYVEISEKDIVHHEPSGQPGVGGTKVWLRSNAPLQYTRITSRQIQAEFLQGPIGAGFRASLASVRAFLGPRPLAHPRTYVCSDYYCGTDFCSLDVCHITREGCYTDAGCGWSEDVCNP
jgi:hypothetical protein